MRTSLTPDLPGPHAPTVGIAVLGSLQVDGCWPPGRRDRVVLSVLVLHGAAGVSTDRLVSALWPNGPPASADKVIQGCVARLRTSLGAQAIETRALGYRLSPDSDVDVTAFEAGIARGRELVTLTQYDRAAFTLSQALALWRGSPYPDLEEYDAAGTETARLHELHLQAEELHVEALLGAGQAAQALVNASAMVGEAPLRERRWLQLALAEYRCGHQERALAALTRSRELLRDELGLDPGPELAELEHAILRQDPRLTSTDGARERDTCPWPGLEAYDVSDAESFFGRDADVVSAVAQLRARGALVVVGPSGIGKSSFVRAGVVPAMIGNGGHVSVITPGAHPPELPATTDLLVVDQLEEVFSLCLDATERERFLGAVVARAERGPVVLALRADRMVEVAAHPGLARLVENGLFLIGGLTESGLRAAIEKPVAQGGWHIEPGLVDLLLRDLAGEPGALPLLSHALAATWQRRAGRTLTVDGYRESGGVQGAVAQSAEAVYAGLSDVHRSSLKDLMLRLVSPGPEGDPVATRLSRRQLDEDPVQRAMVEVLVGSRLVTADDATIRLAHESLTQVWPRLRDWLDDDVEGRRLLHHLIGSAEAWDALGRPDSELYRGVRLARVLEWRRTGARTLTRAESDFLAASDRRADEESRSAEAHARRLSQVNLRLRVAAGVLATVLVAALVLGGVALHQRRAADRAALAAEAGRVGTSALLSADPQLALLEAVAAQRMAPGPATDADLAATLSRHPQLIRTASVPSQATLSKVTAGPGSVFVTDHTHHVTRLTPSRLVPQASYQAGGTEGDEWDTPVETSDRLHLVAVAAAPVDDHPVRLLRPDLTPARRQLEGWPHRDSTLADLAISRDGRYLAATVAFPHVVSDTDGSLTGAQALVWDLRHPGHPVRRIRIPATFYVGVALSPSGGTLYLSNPLTAYDVSSGRRLWTSTEDAFSLSLALDPRGRTLAVPDGRDPSDLALVDAGSGTVRARLRGHTKPLSEIAFSHDGRRVAATAADGRALVWSSTDGTLVDDLDVGTEDVTGLAFSPGDATLYTVTGTPTQIQTWDLDGRRSFLARVTLDRPVDVGRAQGVMLRPSHNGAEVAYMQGGDPLPRLQVFDTASGSARDLATRGGGWGGAGSWSPDDATYAVGYGSGLVQLVDVASGKALASRTVLTGLVMEVAFSPDGRTLAAADDAGNVVLLDGATLRPIGKRVTVPEKIYALAAAPDGHAAFVSAGGTRWRPYWDVPIRHWYVVDLDGGRIVSSGDVGVANAIYNAYSPDGTRVAVGGRSGEVALIDPRSGDVVHRSGAGNAGDVYWVGYNADGSWFASGSTAGDVALWDGHSGRLLATASLPGDAGLAVAGFLPDHTLLITDRSGGLHHWDPSAAHAVAFACRVAGRDLTRAEWAEAFPGQDWRPTCPQ
jgi:WD40 repeat protein/DNA-binding SARP family transcriptional activator